MPPQEAIMAPVDFVIRPPSTTGDDGKPSASLLRDVRRVLALVEDERLLTAHALHQSVQHRLQEWEASKPVNPPPARRFGRKKKTTVHSIDHEYQAAQDILRSKTMELDKLNKRAGLVERAMETLTVDDDWILSQTRHGVTTYYRKEEDDSLSVKLDGELNGVPLFEQVAVLKEVDLHYKWSPFCTSSLTIKDLDKLDTVGWFVVGLPQYGLARDGCFRALGCDCMMEDAKFYLVGQGVEDRNDDEPYAEEYFLENMDGIDIPDPPTRLGSGRMTIRNFSAVIHVLSPTSVRTRIVANVNPNLAFIPQSLIDFTMRKMCGVVLSKLQHAAKKASTDPVRNAHARRMRQEEAFYKGWLMAKFQSYCDLVGWEMPPVPAFSLTPEQLEEEARLNTTIRSAPLPTSVDLSLKSSSAEDNGIHPCASAPNLHPPEISDSASSISSVSGFSSPYKLRTSNRIAQFLKEQEEKTQRAKALKVEEGRKRAADRLRPRTLSHDDRSRLEELKAAKARRTRPRAPASRNIEAHDNEDVVREKDGFADRLHSHDRCTRLTVTTALLFTFLATLYSDVFLGYDSILQRHGDTLWTNLALDTATFLYLGASAFVYFCVCYVALLYAFDISEVGSKIGKSSRQYYGYWIRIGVAVCSGVFVLGSAVYAIGSVWFRAGLWYSMQAHDWATNDLLTFFAKNLDFLPESVQSQVTSVMSTIVGPITTACNRFMSGVEVVRHWFVRIVVQSNFVGRFIAELFAVLLAPFCAGMRAWNSYRMNVVTMYTDDDVALASWRSHAIATARPILVYTAVFLISVLVLFMIAAKSSVKRTKTGKDNATTQETDSIVSLTTPPAIASSRKYYKQPISSISMQEEIIPEDDEVLSTSVPLSVATSPVASTASVAKKKRFRLRVSKKKQTENGRTASIKRMETY